MGRIERISVSGSHFAVGRAVGTRFAPQIHRALDHYRLLQDELLPYHRTAEGQATYRDYLRRHEAAYHAYLEELAGLAEGAGRPFDELLVANLRGEYRGLVPGQDKGCTDCVLLTADAALMGHNEDGSPAFAELVYLVEARIARKPPFVALAYPGFLCGNAFGCNDAGICFSIEDVSPRPIRPGVGRHFVARSLLEAVSLEDAVARATVPGRASGFSYTIGSVAERRILHVEVSPDQHHVREIDSFFCHTNHYLDLEVGRQVIGTSSRKRLGRVRAIVGQRTPRDSAAIRAILGDEADPDYPIYRRARRPDSSATLCTALFDLDARRLEVYAENPAGGATPACTIETGPVFETGPV